MPFIASTSSGTVLGIASNEITSIVSAKANAASTNTSIRVIAIPRKRKPPSLGHASTNFLLSGVILLCLQYIYAVKFSLNIANARLRYIRGYNDEAFTN